LESKNSIGRDDVYSTSDLLAVKNVVKSVIVELLNDVGNDEAEEVDV
jgi:hypothetical protein